MDYEFNNLRMSNEQLSPSKSKNRKSRRSKSSIFSSMEISDSNNIYRDQKNGQKIHSGMDYELNNLRMSNEQLSPNKSKCRMSRRSKSSIFSSKQEISDSHNIYRDKKNSPKKKKNLHGKKLNKIHFLSFSSQSKFKRNYGIGKNYLQFSPEPGYKKKKIDDRTLPDSQRAMKRANSYVAKISGQNSQNNSKDNYSVDCSPKKSMRRRGILRISQRGRKKKMRIRSSAETLQGFNSTFSKPNQDSKLIHNFNIGSLKIRLFAVADGHGNFQKKNYFLLNFLFSFVFLNFFIFFHF